MKCIICGGTEAPMHEHRMRRLRESKWEDHVIYFCNPCELFDLEWAEVTGE